MFMYDGVPEGSAPSVLIVNMFAANSAEYQDSIHDRVQRIGEAGANAMVISPSGQDAASITASIVQAIKDRVKENGTFEEIRFDAHGTSATIKFGEQRIQTDIINLTNALVIAQQELGTKLANKISFQGCNTFTDLTSEQVRTLREASAQLGAELVGTLDYQMAATDVATRASEYDRFISFKDGQVGHFTPDNGNNANLPFSMRVTKFLDYFKSTPHSSGWVQCHEGRTQNEGAACQDVLANSVVTISEADSGLLSPSSAGRIPAAVSNGRRQP